MGAVSRKILILLLLVTLLADLLLVFRLLLGPREWGRGGKEGGTTTFEVRQGASAAEVAGALEERALIRSRLVFLSLLALSNRELRAGLYELSPRMSPWTIVRIISEGRASEVKVTIPEGFAARDIANRLASQGICDGDDFLSEVSNVSSFRQRYTFLPDTTSLEGYLFPDTYRFFPNTAASEVVLKMLATFEKKVVRSLEKELSGKNLHEIVILASIVEREAKRVEDRQLIAAIFQNRLARQIPLEADPTIQYAKGNWEPVSRADYHEITSPFNTYKYRGLPPGPIANPGLASIRAVLAPSKTDALFFFHLRDGTLITSKTREEHDRKKAEYANRR